MKLLQTNAVESLSDNMLSFFDIQDYKSILQFAVEDVNLAQDVSAPKSRVDLENAPHIVQPLSKCVIEKGKRKQIVIAFPQQMGKTLIQMIALLYNSVYNKMQSIVLYPSSELAVETNATKLIPLFKSIPQFAKDLQLPFAIRSDRIKTANNLIYFGGAGTKCVSRSCKMTCADEAAVWVNPPNVDNLVELQKRTRSYAESLNLIVSTPTYKENPFWREFLKGSQGYYYLRCCNCRELTMKSCNLNLLQFDSTFNDELKQYQVQQGTCRIICPQCKYEHTEEQKEWMIKNGGYVHTYPQLAELNPSYQCSVLASLLSTHCWNNIANIILSQGKKAELTDYVSFDNSIRGLPYQHRDYNKQDETAISKHFYQPSELKKQDIEAIYISADTQDTFSVVGVFAYTKQDNLYLIELGRPRYLFLDDEERKIIDSENQRNGKQPQITVLDYINGEYYGIKPLCALIDEKGHRSDQIKNFSKLQKNILMYAGTNLRFDKWKISDNNPKLFLCDARKFQADLIFKLYFQQNRQSNYLYLPKTLTDKDIQEITSFQPNNEKRNGHLYQMWQPKNDAVHDCFDVLKMAICAVNISTKIYRKQRFIHGEARILNTNQIKVKKPISNKKQMVIRKPLFNSGF